MAEPFYKTSGGLRFSCTQCGNCCTRPGPVYFPPEDLERAAAFLSLPPQGFAKKFKLVKIDGILTLEPPDGTPCTFYDPDQGCGIYEARPVQCSTWPFWPEVARRKKSWEAAAKDCPGMNQGKLHSPRAVERHLEICGSRLPQGEPWD